MYILINAGCHKEANYFLLGTFRYPRLCWVTLVDHWAESETCRWEPSCWLVRDRADVILCPWSCRWSYSLGILGPWRNSDRWHFLWRKRSFCKYS